MNKFASSCAQCCCPLYLQITSKPKHQGPKILPCGHTACSQCACITLANHRIHCKLCLVDFDISSKFPVNLYLIGSIAHEKEVARSKYGAEKNPISIPPAEDINDNPEINTRMCCECATEAASCQCENCKDIYCSPCFTKVHSSGRSLKQHRKRLLSDNKNLNCKLTICSTHPENTCSFFCQEDDTAVCPSCAIVKHNGHTLLEIVDKNKEMVPEVLRSAKEAKVVLKKLEESRKNLEKMAPNMDLQQMDKTRHAMTQHFLQLHGILQLKEAALTKQLNDAEDSARQDIKNLVKDISGHISQMQELLKGAYSAVEEDMLANVDLSGVSLKLKDVTSLPCQLTLPQEDNALTARFEAETLRSVLESHCKVHIDASAPPTLISLLPEELQKNDSDDDDIFTIAEFPKAPQKVLQVNILQSHDTFKEQKSVIGGGVDFQPRSGSAEVVVVSHIETPNSFYVQREKDLTSMRYISRDIKISWAASKPYKDPQIDGLCLAQYKLDKTWYRGRVKKIFVDENGVQMANIFFIDYGNSDIFKTSMLRDLADCLIRKPPLAIHCSLASIVPNGEQWSEEAVRILIEMGTRPKVQMLIKGIEEATLQVDLLLLDSDFIGCYQPQSVRDTLVFHDHARLTAPPSPPPRITYQHREFLSSNFDLRLGSNQQIIVSHVESPHRFFVQRMGEHARHLTTMMKKMGHFYDNDNRMLNIFAPKIGMQCAAKYTHDNCWYRALVVGIPEKRKVTVMFVDYGNMDEVEWFNVKKLDDKFSQTDVQAICCSLSNVELPKDQDTWPDDATLLFRSLTYQKILRMTIDNHSRDVYNVTLIETVGLNEFSINGKLISAGYGRALGKRPELIHVPPIRRVRHISPVRATLGPSLLNSNPSYTFNHAEANGNDVIQVDDDDEEEEEEEENEEQDQYRIPVEVLSHNSPGEIYCKILSLQKELDIMIEQMQIFYKKAKCPDATEWSVDDKCVVQRPTDDFWCRAVVLEIQDNKAKVSLVDIAEVLHVSTSKLHPLATEFSSQFHGAVRCHLAGINAAGDRPDVWTLMSGEILTKLLNTYTAFYITKKGEIVNQSLPVELWVEIVTEHEAFSPVVTTWVTINQMLVDEGVARPIKGLETEGMNSEEVIKELQSFTPSTNYWNKTVKLRFGEVTLEKRVLADKPEEPALSAPDWPAAEPPTKLQFEALATHVDDECHIYLQEMPKSEIALKKMVRVVKQYYADSEATPQKWRPGDICLARYHVDSKWYRAKIVKVPSLPRQPLTVLFVDFGNCEEVTLSDLRKANHLNSIPVQSIKCTLVAVGPKLNYGMWRTEDLDLIHGCVVDKKCQVTLLELPKPGETVKVLKIVTELNRDIVDFMIASKLCRRVPVGISSPVTDIPSDDFANVNGGSTDTEIIAKPIMKLEAQVKSEVMQVEESEITIETNHAAEATYTTSENASKTVLRPPVLIPEKSIELDIEKTSENNVDQVVETNDINMAVDDPVSTPETNANEPTDTPMDQDESSEATQCKEDTDSTPVIVMLEESATTSLKKENGDSDMEQDEPVKDQKEVEPMAVVSVNNLECKKETPVTSALSTEPEVIIISSSDDEDESSEPVLTYSQFSAKEDSMQAMTVTVIISATELILKPDYSNTFNLEECPTIDPLKGLLEEMSREAANQPLLTTIKQGQPCCCCYMTPDDWFRGEILEVGQDKTSALVVYVDYGNVDEIQISKLHCMKAEWMKLPAQALLCKVKGVETMPDCDPLVLQSGLSEALLMQPLVAKFKCGQKPYIVELLQSDGVTSVYQNMVDSKLLKFTN